MNLTITSKQFRQLWIIAENKNECVHPRIKDRAWSCCQIIQLLGGKEYNKAFIKELGL